MVFQPRIETKSFLDNIDQTRIIAQKGLNKNHQSELGQFFTPLLIARKMANMFTDFPPVINLLDPGAGIGILTAAFIANAVQRDVKPKKIFSSVFEIDSSFQKHLKYSLENCKLLCARAEIEFTYEIQNVDFIEFCANYLLSKGSFFSETIPDYNFSILNPPYKKINSTSRTKRLLQSLGIETTNQYSAFMWLVMKLLAPQGEMVAIVPRSFCNGTYYLPFRTEFLSNMRIDQIHVYETRDVAFKEEDVLQENIIFHSIKTRNPQDMVVVSSSLDPEDEDAISRQVKYTQLISPDDPNRFIRIVPNNLGGEIGRQINSLPSKLNDIGLFVSTGRVVSFRVKDYLRANSDIEPIPLIHPENFKKGFIHWPLLKSRKSAFLSASTEIDKLVIPSQYYVLVKRFSSKEEQRRIYAAVYCPDDPEIKRIGIENHINYFYRKYGVISLELAKGLTAFLNSTIIDEYFRQFSGHTQVNVGDLQNLRYPTEEQLISIGKKIGDIFPDQDELDNLIDQELNLNNQNENSTNNDPIKAKKKIKEALHILQLLSVPREQQNDRSALTLLSLLNLKPSSKWLDAEENLIGITEMMEFFKLNYGINYAPNTRETVRRQTVHQFIQMGFVISNPDDTLRPINSPKTRYVIDKKLLDLLRTYSTNDWEGNFHQYMRESTLLGNLQVRERNLPMIPVTLPDGEMIMLTSGGQNNLVKEIIENFCPRFTPGGKVVYIGDAGNKITDNEINYFKALGINIDPHGKMPDVIVEMRDKKWLIVIEAVTSHGPINIKRHNELRDLLKNEELGLVFVTAFETRRAMHRFLNEIDWETEVWVSESPSHLIHFNGERFLGPYNDVS